MTENLLAAAFVAAFLALVYRAARPVSPEHPVSSQRQSWARSKTTPSFWWWF